MISWNQQIKLILFCYQHCTFDPICRWPVLQSLAAILGSEKNRMLTLQSFLHARFDIQHPVIHLQSYHFIKLPEDFGFSNVVIT